MSMINQPDDLTREPIGHIRPAEVHRITARATGDLAGHTIRQRRQWVAVPLDGQPSTFRRHCDAMAWLGGSGAGPAG